MQSIRHAVELQPGEPEAWLIRGTICEAFNQSDEAYNAYSRAIVQSNGEKVITEVLTNALFRRSDLLLRLNRGAESLADYKNWLEVASLPASECNDMSWNIVVGPKTNRNSGRAVLLSQNAVSREERNWMYIDTLGVAYYRAGDYLKATESLQKAVNLAPSHRRTFDSQLRDLLETTNSIAGLLAAQKALKLAPDYPYWWQAVGWFLMAENKLPEALEAFTKAIALAPTTDPTGANIRNWALRRRSEVYHTLSREQEAQADLFLARGIFPRSASTSADCLDLSAQFNAGLYEDWTNLNDVGNNLAGLANGLQTIQGVQFEVGGIVQLGNRMRSETNYPVAVTNIPVGLACKQMHFLVGARWADEESTVIARFGLHMADGTAELRPLVYGVDVRNWQFWPDMREVERKSPKPSIEMVADRWREYWPDSGVRLYTVSWSNPHPEAKVVSLDFISAMQTSAPFLIAVTVDPP